MPDIRVIGHATDASSSIALVESLHPDVAIMDIRMPGMITSFEAIKLIMESVPETKILLATSYAERYLILGTVNTATVTHGYILKESPPEVLQEAIRSIHAGTGFVDFGLIPLVIVRDDTLTTRETEVAKHLSTGLTSDEIATVLFISGETVKTHIRNISKKLGAKSRTQAVAIAIKRRLI